MSAPGRREVAHRLFAAEYDDATLEYSESDEERAPNYVVTPTGARVNRLFLVGVLTEVESVSEEVLRARVADPTGAFVVYAGQYQPEALAFLERVEPPTFLAVTGKARTFTPEDSDRVFTSVRPESINEVDAGTRDRWTLEAAEATLRRVATFAAALELGLAGEDLRAALAESGVDEDLAAGVPRALDQYGTGPPYLAAMRDVALDAARWVADELDEVAVPDVAPADPGEGTVDHERLGPAVGAVVDLVEPERLPSREASAEPAAEEPPAGTSSDALAEDETSDAEPPGEDSPAAGPDAEEPPDVATASSGEATPAEESRATTAEESPATPAGESASTVDDVGDFEPGGVGGDGTVDDGPPSSSSEEDASSSSADEPGDVLDDEERERIEEEYPGFSTGSEVDEPGAADIEPEAGSIEPGDEEGADEQPAGGSSADEQTPEPADDGEPSDAAPAAGDAAGDEGDAAGDEGDPAPEEEPGTQGDEPADADEGEPAAGEGEPAADVDLEDAVVEAMVDLDDGDGADGEAVVAAVVDEHGVDPGAVEDAIQDALMAGKCYEPDDGVYKPI